MALTQRQMSNLPKEPTLKDGNKVVGFKNLIIFATHGNSY